MTIETITVVGAILAAALIAWLMTGSSRINADPDWMPCPDCRGRSCGTCGGDGFVPTWLANPNVNEAADTWRSR